MRGNLTIGMKVVVVSLVIVVIMLVLVLTDVIPFNQPTVSSKAYWAPVMPDDSVSMGVLHSGDMVLSKEVNGQPNCILISYPSTDGSTRSRLYCPDFPKGMDVTSLVNRPCDQEQKSE